MKRQVWIIINMLLICGIMVLNYYHGGYYLSKEQCIEESMRSLYIPEGERILELCNGNYCKTLFDHGDSFSLVGTRQIGFLYRVGSTDVECRIDKSNSFFHWTGYSADYGAYTVIHRNNERVSEIRVELNTGDILILNDWKSDYAVFIREKSDRRNAFGMYRAYDKSGHLIEEIDYFSE